MHLCIYVNLGVGGGIMLKVQIQHCFLKNTGTDAEHTTKQSKKLHLL